MSDSIGLNFNSGSPVEYLLCPMDSFGWGATAVMCDTNGNLLFYSNGDSIWNQNHQTLPNGIGGQNFDQSHQSAISIPKPGSDNIYYIFTSRMFRSPNPMFYFTIDMNGNNGLGEVIDIDTIATGWDASDQLAAVYHKNKVDIWIVVRKHRECKYAAFLVTSDGVNHQPVLSPAPNTNYLDDDRDGFLKFSYDKKYFATCFRKDVELCKFDTETGSAQYLSKFRLRDLIAGGPAYVTESCDYSPCSKYMYLTGWLHADSNTHVFQLDMQYIEDSVLFEQSIIEVGEGQGLNMQLAADGKIYLFFRDGSYSPTVNNYVGVIHNPEKQGLDCNFQTNLFSFTQGRVTRCFVNFVTDYLFRFDFDGICESDTFTFDPWFFPEPTFIEWNFGDPLSGINNTSTIPHATHKFTDGGTYEVSVYVEYPSGRIEETSREVEVEYAPEPDLGPDTSFCSTSGITLDAECGPHFYSWSTGAIGSSQIIVYDTGWYWVRVENDAGCFEIDSIHLELYPPAIADTLALEIKPTTCGGSTGVIRGILIDGLQPLSWYWQDDLGDSVSTSLDIYHLPVGNYTLAVLDGNGCITEFGPYHIHDAGEVLIDSLEYTMEHCGQQDASITVHAVSGLGDMLFYSIDNGANYYTNQGIFTGLSAGNYAVRVRDSSDCQDVYVNNPVVIDNMDAPEITSVNVGACTSGQNNGSIEITAIGGGDTLYYSNDNGLTFQVNNGGFYDLLAGFYTCVVVDEAGCDTTFIVEVPEEITLRLQAVAGEDEVCPGNTAFVPLYVSNFNDVANFRTILFYDNSLIICSGFANAHSQLEDSLEVLLFPAEGKVELSWHAPSVSLPDNTVINDLVFESLDPGLSMVAWDGSAGASLFLNSTGLTIPVDYNLGSVRIYEEVFFILEPQVDVCQGDDIEISPMLWSSNGEVSYLWSDPSGTTSTSETLSISNAQPTHSGIWTLKVSDTLDCYSEDSVEILIHPNPVPSFAWQDTIVTEEPVDIDAGSGFANYFWNTGETTPLITAEVQDWYSVLIESQYGCFGQDSVYVLFWEPPEPISDHFQFPNAFTPDNDGLNDEFKLINPPDNVGSFHMYIFNRWGQMVFESGDISRGWDGMIKGTQAPAGTYVFRVEYSISNRDFDISGTVVLVR